MRFTKPDWVIHHDGTKSENAKRQSIFSVHVHPDGSRIATGGLDCKVRIWSTKPILNQSSELSNKPPKSLCTLTMHTGPVLTVRWAHSGRWLASGSDDEIVMIWDLDPSGAGKVWGSDEVNVEAWKGLKRLPGHESDVTDLAWSPDDRYLASTGLDSKVIIWCGYTLERLAKLDFHQGFVKGVCWDPVGEFLATQSDDRTVRIWRTIDWGLEATVTKPFEHSPGSTFFRRLSWSPDGAHITASNATNNNGFVFTAAVITRNTWTSDISLVGHENTVEVANYNPHIFLRDPSMPVVTSNICSVVALGADDCSVSVWQTKSARPLIVAKEVFERQIMDLSWSWDGLTLYAVSSDGTLAVFAFDNMELEGIAPVEAQKQYLQKFGFVPPPLPHGYSHVVPPSPQHNLSRPRHVNGHSHTHGRSTPPLTPPRNSLQNVNVNGLSEGAATGHEQVTTLVARRAPKDRSKEKRRVQPTFVGSIGGMGNSGPSTSMISGGASSDANYGFGTAQLRNGHVSTFRDDERASGSGIKLPLPPLQMHGAVSTDGFGFDNDMGMDIDNFYGGGVDMDVPINALDSKLKRGKSDSLSVGYGDDGNIRLPKARTLGGDRLRDREAIGREIREIRTNRGVHEMNVNVGAFHNTSSVVLPAPSLKTFLEVRVEETGDILEARNSDDGKEPPEVTFYTSKDKTVQWLDYLPSPVLSICASSRFCAVAMEDGTINVYSLTGRRLIPTLNLGYSVAFLDASKYHLMAITSTGQVFVWNAKNAIALHPPVSLMPILIPSPPSPSHPNGRAPAIVTAIVRSNGAILIQLSTGVAYSYDASLLCWIRVSESWWASGSNCWKSRQRSSFGGANMNSSSNAGVVAAIEARISEQMAASGASSPADAEKQRPQWWAPALTLGHLETRMQAARVLESPSEYKQALLLYAKVIADEGFRGKAEEILKELYGPVYWRPGRTDDSWNSTILGLPKRDLTKEVLNIFARSKSLFKLAQDYQELLKKANTDD